MMLKTSAVNSDCDYQEMPVTLAGMLHKTNKRL